MKISTVIIDPDPQVRRLFKNMVEEFISDLEVMGEAESVSEAKTFVPGMKPGLLVIDWKSEQKGRELLQEWKGKMGFSMAIMADYQDLSAVNLFSKECEIITKPINVENVRQLAKRLVTKVGKGQSSSSDAFLVPDLAQIGNQNSKIALPVSRGFRIMRLSEILYCSADRVYSDFTLTSGEQITASRSLKYFEELLAPFGFLRVHSSFLVNLDHVREYYRGAAGKGGVLVFSDDQQIPVARGRKVDLLEKFFLP